MPMAVRRPEAAPTPEVSWALRRPEAAAVLVALVGLLVQCVGYAVGWRGDDGTAIVLWYVGFTVVVAPFAALLALDGRTAHQRLGAALALTLLVYASWLLSNPVMSTRFDENLHVTTLVDLVEHAEFFRLNSMLPVSPHFPGLELATAGVHWLTGLPLFVCQVVVVLTARVTFVTALFLMASRIGRSPRVGGFAVLVYTASTQFYFFNAQFSYQTVAIAMVMAAFYLLVRAFDSAQEWPWTLLLTAQTCLAALAVTHHLTSWITIATLWVLALSFWWSGERRRLRLTLVTAEMATAVVAAWTAVIAPLLVDYLGPIFREARNQIAAVVTGGSARREAGVAADGSTTPQWEVVLMASSVLLWCLLLVPAAWRAWRGGSVGATRARYVPLLVAVAYPALQAARFSPVAGEIGDRASTFVFMAMALVVGAWLAARVEALRAPVVPGALVLVMGGTLIGSGPDWQRVPGPFIAGAEQRSIDATTVSVARWAARHLPEGSNVASDFTFSRLIPNFADVTAVTQPAGFESVTPMFISETMDQTSLELILRNEIDFVVVDTRLVGQTQKSGCFYEGCAGYGDRAATVTAPMVDKFADAPGFVLVLDGPVEVYDVREVRGVPATFEDRPDPGLPGTWTPWQVCLTAVLLVVALGLRRHLLDLRRFHAGDLGRFALVIPAAMALGVVAVVLAFEPLAGAAVAVAVVAVLLRVSHDPDPLPRAGAPSRAALLAGGLLLAVCVALTVWAAWHGLLDGPRLPAPAPVAGS